MGKSKSKETVDRAVATIKEPTGSDALKVSVTGTISAAMAKSPDWAGATDVQAAVKGWTASAAAIEANSQIISGLRAQLATAESKQLGLRRDWLSSRKQVTSSVTVYCGGSADMVKGFGLDVITNGRLGLLDSPVDVAVNPGAVTGEVLATWTKGIAVHGFVVQHATDPTNPSTISGSIPSTKPRFTLTGLASSANVSIRVAAIDPASSTGQSPWSAWVIGNAR
jgi:hypothetical protein